MADMRRRDFLHRTSLVLAGGLIVGDAALELFERLSHRKVWALGEIPRRHRYVAIPCTRWDDAARLRQLRAIGSTLQNKDTNKHTVAFVPSAIGGVRWIA